MFLLKRFALFRHFAPIGECYLALSGKEEVKLWFIRGLVARMPCSSIFVGFSHVYLGFVCIYVYTNLEVHIRKARNILPFHLGFVFLGDFHLMMQTYTVYKQFLCVFQYLFEYCVSNIFVFQHPYKILCIYIYRNICISYMYIGFFLETPLCFGCNQFNVFFWWSHQIEGTTCLFICKFLNGEREKTHTHTYILHWVNPGVRETMNYFNNIMMFFRMIRVITAIIFMIF